MQLVLSEAARLMKTQFSHAVNGEVFADHCWYVTSVVQVQLFYWSYRINPTCLILSTLHFICLHQYLLYFYNYFLICISTCRHLHFALILKYTLCN